MRILSFLILSFFLFAFYQTVHSPHGPNLKISCKVCHSTKGWAFDKENYSFDHNRTRFPLAGQHATLNCKDCHVSLVFSAAKTECHDCHKDVHETTVGPDCSRCHTTSSWLVSDITGIHRMGRFPLLGPHRTADCSLCHNSENPLRFDVIGANCIDCHRVQFLATTNPNHIQAGFSQDCASCHSVNSFQWSGAGFNHAFFPLVLGHSNLKCTDCHTTGNYRDTNSDCYSCHQQTYLATTNPNHVTSNFPTDCKVCHSLNPGWKPAKYAQHDSQFFPIYSGRHNGLWTSCTDCHNTPSNYALFTCIICHEHSQANTDPRHGDVGGYVYSATSCYSCHPTGGGGGKRK